MSDCILNENIIIIIIILLSSFIIIIITIIIITKGHGVKALRAGRQPLKEVDRFKGVARRLCPRY